MRRGRSFPGAWNFQKQAASEPASSTELLAKRLKRACGRFGPSGGSLTSSDGEPDVYVL